MMVANEKTWVGWTGEPTPVIDEGLRAGLALLWRAYICTQATGAKMWDFAMRSGRLYEAGMTSSHLRWMVARGLAQHQQEASVYESHRSLRGTNGYFSDEHTCLILTPSGAALAEHVFREKPPWPQASLSALAAVAEETSMLATVRRPGIEALKPVAALLKPCW